MSVKKTNYFKKNMYRYKILNQIKKLTTKMVDTSQFSYFYMCAILFLCIRLYLLTRDLREFSSFDVD